MPLPRLSPLQARYLDLLEDELLGLTQLNDVRPAELRTPIRRWVGRALRRRGIEVMRRSAYAPEDVEEGRAKPDVALTMVGRSRLAVLRTLVCDVVHRGVPGDLIETGVWRGGAVAYMRGVLAALDVVDRTVVAADSFAGLPPPDPETYPADAGINLHIADELAVDLDTVQENLRRLHLLDDQVQFVPGWFRDTLPGLAERRWALVRLDGDLYESTMNGLANLYPQLSEGGYIVVDDYGEFDACRTAVDEFREAESIESPITWIDHSGVYWAKRNTLPDSR